MKKIKKYKLKVMDCTHKIFENVINHKSPGFSTYPFYFFITVFCLVLNGCQEQTRACLDVKATNFDVTAALPCEDNCCIYPFLTLQIDHVYDSTKFSLNKKYKIDNSTDSIEFISFQFYLSDFQLITNDNKTATVIDSTIIARETDSIKVLSNFVLIGKNYGFDYKIGKFDKPTNYAKLKFQVGLDSKTIQAVPKNMPSTSPLSIQRDSMYLSTAKTFIFNKIVYKLKSRPDTVSLFITIPAPIEINQKVSFTEGFDAKIPLKVNYKAFIKDVNFTEPKNVIQQKIVSNTNNVFSFQ